MTKSFVVAASTLAQSHRRFAAGVRVASALVLLLLAFAACSQAALPNSPNSSISQTPVVTVVPVERSGLRGNPLLFQVRADPAPRADLTVSVTIASSGCELPPSHTVPINAGASLATLRVPTADVKVGAEGCEVTASVARGQGYAVAEGETVDGSPSPSVTIAGDPTADAPIADAPIADDETPGPDDPAQEEPLVTIGRLVDEVTEGDLLRFELTADPAPAVPLTTNLLWNWPEELAETPPATVTIPTSGTFTLTAATFDDDIDNQDRTVHVTVAGGAGYRVGDPNSAGIKIKNNDFYPRVTLEAAEETVAEGDSILFTLTATPAPASPLTVNLRWLRVSDRLVGDPPPENDTVTIPTSGTLKIPLHTVDDLIDNYSFADYVVVGIHLGHGYVVGTPFQVTVTVEDDEFTPLVSVVADATPVAEGTDISFTLTAEPAPASPLTVNLEWDVSGLQRAGAGPDTVTIPPSGTATVTLATKDDAVVNSADTTVKVTLLDGDHYFRDTSVASITIEDDD